MMKNPIWGNALLIINVHLAHDTRKFHKKFILFSLDILHPSTYCEGNNRIYHSRCVLPQCPREYYS